MKASLQLSLGQQLTLTPQLQQAIRLLQLSTLDLQQEIQTTLESNPMLEAQEENDEHPGDNHDTVEQDLLNELNDIQWSQLYNTSGRSTNFNEPDYNLDNLHSTTSNLQDHLRWQLNLTPLSEVDYVIALALIDAVNDDGLLSISVEDIFEGLKSDSYDLDMAEIEAVRHRIQLFDPIGCASSNLADCLLIQLNQLEDNGRIIKLCKKIIKDDIEALAQHNYRLLTKKYKINEQGLDEALKTIQSLNPRPGDLIHKGATEYVIPDVSVKKEHGTWQVRLNESMLPRLSINQQYASLVQRANNSSDNQYLKQNLQEARWFLKSIPKSKQR